MNIVERLKQAIVALEANIQALALAGSMIAFASSSLIPVTQPLIYQVAEESHITLEAHIALGVILSVASLASSLISVVGGLFADKYGRKLILILGIVSCSIGAVIYFKAETIPELLIAVPLSAIGTSIILSTMTAMTAESVADRRRASAFSYVEILRAVGSVLGPIIGSLMWVFYGIKSPYLFAFTMYLLSLIGVVLLLKETHKGEKHTRIFPWKLSEIKQIHHSLPDSRSLYMLVLAQIIISFGVSIGGSISIQYAKETIGADEFVLGIIPSLPTAISIIVMIYAAMITDKVGRIPPLLAHEILVVAAQFGYAFAQTPIHLILVSILGGIGTIGVPAFRALQTELMPQEHRAKLLSFYSFISVLAAVPGPLISGFIWDSLSPSLGSSLSSRIMFVISGFLVIPTAIVVYTSVKETLRKPREKPNIMLQPFETSDKKKSH